MTRAIRLNSSAKIPGLSGVIAAKAPASAAVDPAAFEAHACGLIIPDARVYRAADRLISTERTCSKR